MEIVRNIVTFMIFLLLIIGLVPAVHAANGEQTMITSQHPDNNSSPILIFDNISMIKNNDYDKKNYTGFFPEIKKFDVIRIDKNKLIPQLVSGERIPIHLNGIPYGIIPYSPNLNTNTEFVGQLENSSGSVVKNYIVQLDIDNSISGQIYDSETDTYYYLYPLSPVQPNDEILHLVYLSKPGEIQGFNIGGDSIVVVKSGEGKTFSQMTPEDIEWLRSQQIKNENKSTIQSDSTTAKPAPMPALISFIALVVSGITGMYLRRVR